MISILKEKNFEIKQSKQKTKSKVIWVVIIMINGLNYSNKIKQYENSPSWVLIPKFGYKFYSLLYYLLGLLSISYLSSHIQVHVIGARTPNHICVLSIERNVWDWRMERNGSSSPDSTICSAEGVGSWLRFFQHSLKQPQFHADS